MAFWKNLLSSVLLPLVKDVAIGVVTAALRGIAKELSDEVDGRKELKKAEKENMKEGVQLLLSRAEEQLNKEVVKTTTA